MERRQPNWFFAAIAVLAFGIAAFALGYALGGHRSHADEPSDIPKLEIHTSLDHLGVEQYIESSASFGHPTGVICNHGQNVAASKGKTFTCVASDASTFHVEITNPDDAEYVVTPG